MLKEILREMLREELEGESNKNVLENKITVNPTTEYSFLGSKVLVRANQNGINTGIVSRIEGEFMTLKDTRKFWRWDCKEGVALESFAVPNNIREDGTRATAIQSEILIRLDDVVGIIKVTDTWYDQAMALPISYQD